jgi:hypothetical protein
MKQFCSERMVTHVRGGRSYRVYEKVGPNVRNEALDVRCYATAARQILNPNYEAIARRRFQHVEASDAPPGRLPSADRHRSDTAKDAESGTAAKTVKGGKQIRAVGNCDYICEKSCGKDEEIMTEPVRTSQIGLHRASPSNGNAVFAIIRRRNGRCEYRFRGPGTGFNVDATADGRILTFHVHIDPVGRHGTSENTNGRHGRQISPIQPSFAKDREGVLIVERGFTTASTGTVELRSTAKQVLDAIDATLLRFGDD